MTLRYNPFTELAETRARLDRLFGHDNLWETVDAPSPGEWVPAMDIVENDDAIAIKADLPGIEAHEVAVTLEGNVLTVSGERRIEKAATTVKRGVEHVCGTFGRSFVLPGRVDAANIKAELNGGRLTLTLPKNGDREVRAITVTPP